MTDFITPPALEPGDKVAIVSPASGLAATFPHVYERGLERIRSVFDLEPVEFPTATADSEFLYNHPEKRAQDIEKAFSDPDIRGVITTIGGNDQIRILDHLDGQLLRENPTRFYGISDNTNLAQFLWNHGIVSYYGGHVLTEFALPGALPEYLESGLRSALFDESIGTIQPSSAFTDQDLGWDDPESMEQSPEMEESPGWLWRGGEAPVTGKTWGGNLEITYLQLSADRYVPSIETLAGKVLLLETSEELPDPGVVQRMLFGMGERGLLERFDGFLVGRIKARSHLVERSKEEREDYRKQVRKTIVDVITQYNATAPIVLNVDFGHTNPIVPVPIGETAALNPKTGHVRFG
ncbi:S66 family peptidase [Natrinema altunense]|uniref:LD-carboxypeptidase n=1 Tax=Natrinema altunense TaxID=222984 RepID=A0A482Y4I1_9EURY|nr:S66 peptidase family protein [Natrinema altunense]RZH67717.1 LD-carboxypeptidase [Natrinema altunense]